jgi:hydroxyacylglutathione hydrolase
MLDVSPVRAFSDNYIWLIRAPADPRAAVVVDPGDDRPVEDVLQAQGLELKAILVTHHHADHVGGVGALAARHDAQVFGPARERMPCEVRALDDGGTAELANLGLEFAVMAIPGHTLGHIAYTGHGALFCGDTLFSAGCGRLFEGTPAQMLDSLDRLASLPDTTSVYCGHEYTQANLRFARTVEPDNADIRVAADEVRERRERDEATLPSTIGRERRINPFLRCRTAAVKAAAERHAGRMLATPVEVFTEVRAWKDGFR